MSKKQEAVNLAKLAKNILDAEVKLKGVAADRAVLVSQTTIETRNKVESTLIKLIALIEDEIQ